VTPAVPPAGDTPEAVPWTPADAWALVADLNALADELARHMQSFTGSGGVLLCGGCLEPVPCKGAEVIARVRGGSGGPK
jgi:hypothetical protein